MRVLIMEDLQDQNFSKAEAPPVSGFPTAGQEGWSPEERGEAKIIGDFIMDLTRAMLRSGYYDSLHPSARLAKQGLFDAFLNALGTADELMLIRREEEGHTDIFVMGVFDEPFDVRKAVGTGMAEIFVPKLRECFHRKGLESFAIKKDITPAHFEAFVDIMSDPSIDRFEREEVGRFLTKSLIDQGIVEVSTVFMEDEIDLSNDLPWRVAIIIRRLAKDLKVLPMFQHTSEEEIRSFKVQIIQDIIRPLREPRLLKDLAVNCDVIAQHVSHMGADEIRETVIGSLPVSLLLPTAQLILQEHTLRTAKGRSDSDRLQRVSSPAGLEKLLLSAARRIIAYSIRDADAFLERLYEGNIIAFEDLPAGVQHRATTKIMAEKIRRNTGKYVNAVSDAEPDDLASLLSVFQRVAPELIARGDWSTLLEISTAVQESTSILDRSPLASNGPSHPIDYIFSNSRAEFIKAYQDLDTIRYQPVDEILQRMGTLSIDILNTILMECADPDVRKRAVESLVRKGEMARTWAVRILYDPGQFWHLQGNALRVLGKVGNKGDITKIRNFLNHPHPKVRIEALNASVGLEAEDAQLLIIKALDDEHDQVRAYAASLMNLVSPLSDESVERLLQMIRAEWPRERRAAMAHARHISRLISTLGAMQNLPENGHVEEAIMEVTQKMIQDNKSFLTFLKRHTRQERSKVIDAAIKSLQKIGSSKSVAFIRTVSDGKFPVPGIARESLHPAGNGRP